MDNTLTNKNLLKENEKLRENIDNLRNHFSYEICKYFEKHNSIKKTAETFYFESLKECYLTLVDYYDGTETIIKAIDYKDCVDNFYDK
jgi:hypothetical protein